MAPKRDVAKRNVVKRRTLLDEKIKTIMRLIPHLNGKAVTVRPLQGGLTNRNYLVTFGDHRFVLRIAGENSALLGIDRHAEHRCARVAFEVGIGPEVVAFLPEHEAMLTRFVPGRTL